MLFKQDPKYAQKIQLANSMLAAGRDSSPVGHPMQAIGRVAQSWAGNRMLEEANDEQTKRRESFYSKLAEAIGGGSSSRPEPELGTAGNNNIQHGQPAGMIPDKRKALAQLLMSDPDTKEYGSQLGIQLAMEQQPERKTLQDASGYHRYLDSGERVFPGAEKMPDLPWYAGRNSEGQLEVDPSYLQMKRDIAQAGKSDVIVNSAQQESEQKKAYGKHTGDFFGGQFTQLQEGTSKAIQDNARLDRLNQLMDQVNVGATAGITQPIKRFAKDLGIDLEAMGIGDDTAPAEAANALANQMALELRNPSGGAGMPGALSDKDREFLTSMVPQLTATHEGRKMLIETRKRQNKRAIEVAELARQYQMNNGMLDSGFYRELQQFAEENPLFGDLTQQAGNAGQLEEPEETRTLNGKQYYRINGKWYEQ